MVRPDRTLRDFTGRDEIESWCERRSRWYFAFPVGTLRYAYRHLDHAVMLWTIGDESPGSSRAATFIVARDLHTLNINALEETVDSESRLHVHKKIVWLRARVSNWDAIPGILEHCRDDSDELAAYAREQLGIWIRRPFIPRGSTDQLSRAAKSLELAKHALPNELIDPLIFMIKTALPN